MSEPLFETTKADLLRASSSPEVWEKLGRLRTSGDDLIHLGVIASQVSPVEILRTRVSRGFGDITLEALEPAGSGVAFFKLDRVYGKKYRHTLSNIFTLTPSPSENIWYFASVAPTIFWRDGLRKLFERLYPTVVRPFFTQKELQQFTSRVEEYFLPLESRVIRTNAKGRLGNVSARKKYISALSWTDSDVPSAFGRAQEDNFWFKSLTLELIARSKGRRIRGNGIQATISKYGYVSCTGEPNVFVDQVLGPMAQSAAERIKFLSSRDKRSSKDSIPRPIAIRYSGELFASKDQLHRLLEVMKRYDHANCSVFHANPYLHLGIVDNFDLSSIDLWVLDKYEILIVPQIRTTDASLKRTINYIFENFREGEIAEAETE